jgi:two-component system, OmpR family, phosphate regulon sensor histidine kinase PhoR
MVLKSKYLISLFATLFLILLGIQVYFMYKTYQVKERDIYRSVNDGLINYTDDLQDLHHTKEMKDDDLQRIIIRYYHKEVSQQDFFRNVTENRKAAIKKLDRYLKNRLKKDGYEISARIRYISIVHLPDSTKVIDRPFTIFETKEKVKNSRIASNNTWETSTTKRHDSGNKEIEKSDTFLVKSQTDFDIRNIRSLVFKDLTLLIICCIALLASVLLLYIFTIKNLIKQQKQVEVLHTVVDNISHEFKTPIATLKIASKTLKKEWNPETLPLIDRQISRLESLLFQLHKEEIPGEANPITPEDWNFFIHDLHFTYPKILFKFENNVSKTLPFDKNLMETVIKNLCENSVKYGASVVGINITHSSENLDIEVSDNGQGIENRELKNIFEKFYRIQGNNIHNTKGLGLGLYIVKKIITNYHGKIEASSQLGKGSIFSLSIPYEMPL